MESLSGRRDSYRSGHWRFAPRMNTQERKVAIRSTNQFPDSHVNLMTPTVRAYQRNACLSETQSP
jgi:hypothetical protein